MKFRRINEDTVRCIVSKEDMQEYGIVLEDFFRDRGKIHDFLHEIVERAGEEIGYAPKEGMLSMQIMPISPNSLSITFSEHEPDNYEDMMNNFKDTLDGLGLEDEDGGVELLDQDEVVNFESEEETPSFTEKQTEPKVVEMEKASTLAIRLESIEKMAEFCKALAIDKPVKSELYELRNQGVYCLVIERGRLPLNTIRHLIILAVEFEANITDDTGMIAHIREYGDAVIEKSAYRILKKYV